MFVMFKQIILLLVLVLSSCSVFRQLPPPEREFRGFWVATVVNIDWPKNRYDSIEKKKKDYLEILDFYKDLNFNAAIVQVRTAGDAFYDSRYSPWSRFLTGKEGEPLDTSYNLLAWMIDEAHKRGMEFHAWLNPYRATFDLETENLSPLHDFNVNPEWMVKYGKKYYYNPGLPDVRKKMTSIIEELVTNYDIDAIHYDDYFYPYTIAGEVFDDSLSFRQYGLPNQTLEDWRRSNMDSLIKNSYQTIKTTKPSVEFGVSPFGVWKNKTSDPRGSDTQAGQTTFENLYADPLLWMENGWLDYLVPQVYWSMDYPVASHRKIVDWWSKNSTNTNLYIGNGPYKIKNNSDSAWDKKKELPKQLNLARTNTAVQGNVFFSAKSLMQDHRNIVRHLKRNYYKYPALTPVSKSPQRRETEKIEFRSIIQKADSVYLNFNDLSKFEFVMMYTTGKKKEPDFSAEKIIWKTNVSNRTQLTFPNNLTNGKKYLQLVFIDSFGKKSNPIMVHLK